MAPRHNCLESAKPVMSHVASAWLGALPSRSGERARVPLPGGERLREKCRAAFMKPADRCSESSTTSCFASPTRLSDLFL
jgi:hypothetical protein